jgi:tryptophanyl-tRNA synthetase
MKATKMRILTGHRPTGPRHIGHLVGTLQNWVKLQQTDECFFLIADLHVLTTDFQNPDKVQANSLAVLTDWLAAGVDPHQATIILQSAVPEHAQLSLLLSMIVKEARLRRIPTYKEQIKELNLQPSLGLLTYPVLQTADILLYKGVAVPVGEDQLPHLELAREIARRFNQLYGDTFPEPNALLSSTPRLPGTDNRSMHASYGNTILLQDTPEITTKKVMNMYTDPGRLHTTDPGNVENNPVFTYLDIFEPNIDLVMEFKSRYRQGKIGDIEIKQHLAQVLNQYLAPIRSKRSEISGHNDYLLEILREGSHKARKIAQNTFAEVEEKMGLTLKHTISN